MREALGLRSNGTRVAPAQTNRPDRAPDHSIGAPRRHRFVQEGEVPVEVMTLREHGGRGAAPAAALRQRSEDPAILTAERSAREHAERALADAMERVRELQTKLGHAELARDEAVALAAQRQALIESLQADLHAATTREASFKASQETARAHVAVRKASTPKPPAVAKPPAVPRPRGRKPVPKPVKWWVKPSP